MALISVTIKKAMAKLEVDTDAITDVDTYIKIFAAGLDTYLNGKMTKLKDSPKALKEALETGTEAMKAKAQEAMDAAMVQAKKNLDALIAGTYQFGRAAGVTDASGAKLSREVNTEAMRVARGHVKDWLKSQKIPFNQVPAAEITKGAKIFLEQNPQVVEEAKATIAAKSSVAFKMPALDASKMVSPELVEKAKAKNEARKAAGKGAAEKMLSAFQAGQTSKVRPRPQPAMPTQH